MPLFALVACTEDENSRETFILHMVTQVSGMKHSELMNDYVKEIAKTNNANVKVEQNDQFKKDKFTIYTTRLNIPDISFMAFTDKGYSSGAAYAALEEFKELFFERVESHVIYNVTEDQNLDVKGSKSVLKAYFKGNLKGKVGNTNDRVKDITDRARKNYEETFNVKQQTDSMLFYTKKMEENTDGLGKYSGSGYRRKNCCVCLIF